MEEWRNGVLEQWLGIEGMGGRLEAGINNAFRGFLGMASGAKVSNTSMLQSSISLRGVERIMPGRAMVSDNTERGKFIK